MYATTYLKVKEKPVNTAKIAFFGLTGEEGFEPP